MKYLKKFNESREQLFDADEGRKVLSQVYDIVDEIPMHRISDFLVDVEKFIEYAEEYDGYFAGNRFDTFDEFKQMLDIEIEGINAFMGSSPIYYVAPHWFSRTPDDILKFEDVYSATIYTNIDDDVIKGMQNDEDYKRDIWSSINDLRTRIEADEAHIMKSVKGKYYLRIWWD